MGYAETTDISPTLVVLFATSALAALVPFVYIWKILWMCERSAKLCAGGEHPHYGWMAVCLRCWLTYLHCGTDVLPSVGVPVATNLRLAVSEHLAVLPLGR